MEEVSAQAKLVDRTPDVQAHGLAATVSRHEIEDVLQAEEGQPELLLDVTRSWRDNGQQRVESRTVAVEWERADLERLLKQASGDTVTLAIDREVLERALAEDVEAHSLRGRALVLTVAVATGAFGAGSGAGAIPASGGTASGEAGTPQAYLIEDVRAGEPAPGTPEAYAIEDVRAGQPVPEATPVGDEGTRIPTPSPAEAAGLAGATALAIVGAAFVARGRRQPRPT